MFAYVTAYGPAMARLSPNPSAPDAVAHRLLLLRRALGHTQAFMAGLLGSAPQAWANYESGGRLISISLAMKLCAVTGVSLDWIYRGNMAMLPAELAEKIQIEMRLEAGAGRKIIRRS